MLSAALLTGLIGCAGLHNDLRGTMDELHRVLNSIHTAVRNSEPTASPPRFLQSPPSGSCASTPVPFAVVQHVERDSPAAQGGLELGDKVIKFGDAQGPAGLTILQSQLQVWVSAPLVQSLSLPLSAAQISLAFRSNGSKHPFFQHESRSFRA